MTLKNMTKKQNHKSAAEVKADMNSKADQVLFEKVSKELQEVLEANGCALQPFLSRNDFTGDMPRVRLVRMPKPEGVVKPA